jgi:tRNA(Arg) A34 adenosine deaminase TadA
LLFPAVSFSLPEWIGEIISGPDQNYPTPEDKMDVVIQLARKNIRHGGGPFGAAIFDSQTHRLISPGVNLVLRENCSVLHAEMVAIMLAQKILGSYDLAAAGTYELVTSTEPCAMCLGAIPWSGVTSLVCGAHGEDAQKIGFDEGEKPTAWADALENRGIRVTCDICRGKAVDVLQEYAVSGGTIYNGRQ